ncbi:hypothetical protein ACOME3_001799 [Neoechinorhynchus agilis]
MTSSSPVKDDQTMRITADAIKDCCEDFPSLCEETFGRDNDKKKSAGGKGKPRKAVKRPAEKTLKAKKGQIRHKQKRKVVKQKKIKVSKKPMKSKKAIGERKKAVIDLMADVTCDPNNVPYYTKKRRALGCLVKRTIIQKEDKGQTGIKEASVIEDVMKCLRYDSIPVNVLKNRIKFTVDRCVAGERLIRGSGGTIRSGPKMRYRCAPGIPLFKSSILPKPKVNKTNQKRKGKPRFSPKTKNKPIGPVSNNALKQTNRKRQKMGKTSERRRGRSTKAIEPKARTAKMKIELKRANVVSKTAKRSSLKSGKEKAIKGIKRQVSLYALKSKRARMSPSSKKKTNLRRRVKSEKKGQTRTETKSREVKRLDAQILNVAANDLTDVKGDGEQITPDTVDFSENGCQVYEQGRHD